MPQVGNHSGGKETGIPGILDFLPFYSCIQSRLLLHIIEKSSRQSLHRKRSNYFQQISPKIRRIAAVTEEAVCDRHIITYNLFK